MTKSEYLEQFAKHCLEFVELTRSKMNDYTGVQPSPFRNFEDVAHVEKRGVLDVVLTEVLIKAVRIHSLLEGGMEPENEPLKDSLRDLAIYAIIGMCYIDSTSQTAEQIGGGVEEVVAEEESEPKAEARRLFDSIFRKRGQ